MFSGLSLRASLPREFWWSEGIRVAARKKPVICGGMATNPFVEAAPRPSWCGLPFRMAVQWPRCPLLFLLDTPTLLYMVCRQPNVIKALAIHLADWKGFTSALWLEQAMFRIRRKGGLPC